MIGGRYFDGASTRAEPAQFARAGAALRIQGADFAREVSTADLRFTLSHGAAPNRIEVRGGGLCELENSAESRALLLALGATVPPAAWLETHRMAVAGATLAVIALMAIAWKWGIPLAADLIVDRTPAAWDRRLGDSVLAQLETNGLFRPSTVPLQRQSQVRDRFAALGKRADAPPYRIEFRQLGVPNAFALPGGTIVVADELLALAPDDATAVLTVLGHELGHVQLRHGMRAIVRATLFSAWAAWAIGDISGFAASAAAGFTTLSYSRDAEHAADEYAVSLMHANGLSTHGAAVLFQRLADWQPEKKTGAAPPAGGRWMVPEYLSTHPDIRDRIRLFEDDPGATAAGPMRER